MTHNFSDNALKLLEDRYLVRDNTGEICEDSNDMLVRVSSFIGQNEPDKIDSFYEIMRDLKFLPNSPTLMNAGTKLGQLSACFVLPVEDNMDSIFNAVHDQAIIQKSGGGTGFSFSKLSEKGSFLETSQGKASGPLSFMEVFQQCSKTVEQGGKRRGANMGILSVDHPDIMDFIYTKNRKTCLFCQNEEERNEQVCSSCGRDLPEDTTLSYFNLSVGVTKLFIEKAINYVDNGVDSEWVLYGRRDSSKTTTIKFSELWNSIVYYAWYSGEPGIINLSEINKHNPIPSQPIESTNPCGEQPLRPYDSCNLGSINLDVLTSEDGVLDYNELERVTTLAVDFLDNVIDVNKYPLAKVEESTKQTRNIGLGVMGLARMLQKMEIPYDSIEGRSMVDTVLQFIQSAADSQSSYRGSMLGNFPLYPESIYSKPLQITMRNATRTTIAPTGTISNLANTSGGIEPDFTHRFTRNVNTGDKSKEFSIVVENPVLVSKLKKYGFYSEELMECIENNGGMLPVKYPFVYPEDKLEDWEHLVQVFKTAGEISVDGHIDMLLTVQGVVNNAVSKTINLPFDTSVSEVERAFIRMLKGGAKGVTVYRDGSRMFQPLQAKKKEVVEEVVTPDLSILKGTILERGYVEQAADDLPSIKKRLFTGCGKLYLHADYDPNTGDIKEVFIDKGSEGGCKIFTTASSRLLSVGIRGGIPLDILAEQLNSSGSCPSYQYSRGKGEKVSLGMSCPSAIGKALMSIQKELHESIKSRDEKSVVSSSVMVTTEKSYRDVSVENNGPVGCPECGAVLDLVSGCVTCRECGYSKC